MTATKWLPVIVADRCTGCGACVEACGPGSLEMIDGLAVLVRPDTCGSEEHCIAPCNDDAISMAWVAAGQDRGVGTWKTGD